MDYKIVKREKYMVLAKTKYCTSENSTEEIPKFWTEYFGDGSHETVCGTLGICEQEKVRSKEFRYGIGCECSDNTYVPNGFEKLTIPAYTWAVFKCVGPMPNSIQNMWKRIYSEWLPQSEYELIPDYDIELYTDGNNQSEEYVSEIWIPIKKK